MRKSEWKYTVTIDPSWRQYDSPKGRITEHFDGMLNGYARGPEGGEHWAAASRTLKTVKAAVNRKWAELRESNEANRSGPGNKCLDCMGTGNWYGRDVDDDWLDCETCSGRGKRQL